jgi:hypothetical protein
MLAISGCGGEGGTSESGSGWTNLEGIGGCPAAHKITSSKNNENPILSFTPTPTGAGVAQMASWR